MASTPDRPYGLAPPGFRLPEATRPGAVRLQVRDLARSIDYYEHVIGLRVLARGAASASLGAADGRGLVDLLEKPGSHPVPPHGAYGLYHFAILLPDRPSLGRFLMHAANAVRGRLASADHLVSEAVYLWDPDGLGIEVYADRPRETWRHANQQLVMATDPLDVDALIAQAAGRNWGGAPAGTTMGHVHLHVGDLVRAEAFYHAALGLDKIVWSYPGALFLSAGGYHHHLGTNTWSEGPAARDDQARLLEWSLVVPDADAASAAAQSLRAAGHAVDAAGGAWTAVDPWGTRLRIVT